MRRLAILLVVAVATAFVGMMALPDPPPAEALVPAQVVGRYRLKLKGLGALRADAAYDEGKIRENAELVLTHSEGDANSALVDVEIHLVGARRNSLLERGTPEAPQFRASGMLVGNTLSLIDTGSAGFVNVLTLQFLRNGKKVAGGWITALPATAADRGPMVSLHVAVSGKRVKTKLAKRAR